MGGSVRSVWSVGGPMLRRCVRDGRSPAPDGRIGDQEVHVGVVPFEHQIRDDELLDTDPDPDGTGQARQEPVVHPPPASEPATRRAERDARHDHDVDVSRIDRRPGRLAYTQRTDDQLIARSVTHDDQLVALRAPLDPRKEHAEALRRSREQFAEVHLVGVRRIQEEVPFRGSSRQRIRSSTGPRSRRQLGETAQGRDDPA